MQTSSHFRWVVVGLLFFINVVNYIDRSSMAYAINAIALDFHLSASHMGLLLGAFGVGYLVMTFAGGLAADHYGAKATLLWATLAWALASALIGCSSGFLLMFIARVFLGLAEGPNFPGMTRAVSDWLPETERSRALSLALVSVPLALAMGGPISTFLIMHFSWRGMYFILTGVALLWIPLWWGLFQDKPADSKYVNSMELQYIDQYTQITSQLTNKTTPWATLLGNRTLLANYWAYFVYGFYLFFFMNWLPNYLQLTYHIDLKAIGIYSFFPWCLAAMMMWTTGMISDLILKKTKNLRWSRSYPIMISQLLSALCVVPIMLSTHLYSAMIFISLAIGFAMSANAASYAVNVDIAKERAGTALGIMDAAFALAGFIAPIFTGYIVSWSGQFEFVFYVLIGLAASSAVTTWLFHNRESSSTMLC